MAIAKIDKTPAKYFKSTKILNYTNSARKSPNALNCTQKKSFTFKLNREM